MPPLAELYSPSPSKTKNNRYNRTVSDKRSTLSVPNSLANTAPNNKIYLIIYTRPIVALKSGYKVRKPFEVKITIIGQERIGYIEKLGLYSFEDNDKEIIAELKEDIIDLYETLINLNNSELGADPLKWKGFLTEHVERSR